MHRAVASARRVNAERPGTRAQVRPGRGSTRQRSALIPTAGMGQELFCSPCPAGPCRKINCHDGDRPWRPAIRRKEGDVRDLHVLETHRLGGAHVPTTASVARSFPCATRINNDQENVDDGWLPAPPCDVARCCHGWVRFCAVRVQHACAWSCGSAGPHDRS